MKLDLPKTCLATHSKATTVVVYPQKIARWYKSIVSALEVLRSGGDLIHVAQSREEFHCWLRHLNEFSGEVYVGVDESRDHKINGRCFYYKIQKGTK